jgi:hypothetical protein
MGNRWSRFATDTEPTLEGFKESSHDRHNVREVVVSVGFGDHNFPKVVTIE